MKNKAIFIQPNNTLNYRIYPPLNLILIGSVLEKEGFDAHVIPCPTCQDPISKILDECEHALFVGISVLTSEVPHGIQIAREIKKHYSEVPIVWGGWHATLFYEQMAKSDLVDQVVVGDGERAVIDIAKNVQSGKNTFKNANSKIVKNLKTLDMSTLSAPNYNLVPNIDYYINQKLQDKFLEYDRRKIRWLPYQASRGCPGRCSFCINVVSDNRNWRCKPVDKILREVEKLVKIHDLNHVKIIDDNFFVNPYWVKQIAQGFKEMKLGFTWDAECRTDYINETKVNDALLELCIDSGMNELNFGIESGSQASLNRMKKDVTPEQNYLAVKKASEMGIVSRCSFVIDIPGDTKRDILKTVSLINKIRSLPKTTCGVHTYRPYPRSELCQHLIDEGLIEIPKKFEKWCEERHISQFVYTDAKRIWQQNYQLSRNVSYYQNLESGFWLRPHQIDNRFLKAINILFMKLAYLRNRTLFFYFNIEFFIYNQFFLKIFSKLKSRSDS